ncbi:MAG: hypothetical protein HRU26_04015 [Psychroserpens sp.]|nr:hypothetical protein [Psychroserpens sp.]
MEEIKGLAADITNNDVPRALLELTDCVDNDSQLDVFIVKSHKHITFTSYEDNDECDIELNVKQAKQLKQHLEYFLKLVGEV